MSFNSGFDLMTLYSEWNEKQHMRWNAFLTKCLNSSNSNLLLRQFREIQKGMDDLVKQKLNDQKMTSFFVRLQRSLENTLWSIWLKNNPRPTEPMAYLRWKERKKTAREELTTHIRKESF